MISAKEVSLSYGKRVLFDEVNLHFIKGNCYGVIGANGAGKSTFLKILSGEIEPSKGSVEITPGERLAVLRQDQSEFDDYQALHTVLMGYTGLWQTMQEREKLYETPELSEAEGIRAAHLEAEFGEMGGYTAESDAASLLGELGVPVEYHDLLMAELPGHLKVRVLLAQALFGNPDILLLDEPTNNLDVDTISWLENVLAAYEHIAIVVSHDRHFLDAVCTHVADIDFGKIRIYTGNYSFWYESSQLAARQQGDRNRKTEDKRKELLDFIARFSANASKSKQATSRKKALEKLVIEDIRPSNRKYPGIIFRQQRDLGNQVLQVSRLGKTMNGRELFGDTNFAINKTDKVVLLSQDRMAITSFFETIWGVTAPDSGVFEWGSTVIRAYLPLDYNQFFENDLTLMDWLRQYVPPYITEVDEPFLRGFLGKMLFSGEEILKKTSVLSGGEKMRCMIARMMLQQPNMLILDEPTNHLDLESITALNDGLAAFKGSILLASRDHQLMQTVANRIIEITPAGTIDRVSSFDEYIADGRIKLLRESLYVGSGGIPVA
jgi:ATPase subunit of ABC transporter with duplicated ATPase domains